jgi:hypothetical protein
VAMFLFGEQLTAEKLHGCHVLILPRLVNSCLQKLHVRHVLFLPVDW